MPPSVNVDATQWTSDFATSPAWNCNAPGTTTIDSSAGTVTSTSCALGTLDITTGAAQTGGAGPNVMVIRLSSLMVSNGHAFVLQGNAPIVFLVSGNVVVDTGGAIDASASGGTPGPGGSISASCSGSTGANSAALSVGGGGGGFGTAGGFGSKPDGTSGSAGGIVSTSTNLQPLRGGCSGGTGGGSLAYAGGAGGGAFEISAAGTISIGHAGDSATTSGTLSAAGGFSQAASDTTAAGVDSASGGAGSGGGILLVSPTAPVLGPNAALRVHGGGSGSSRGSNAAGNPGSNGHTADDTAAAGGVAPDTNAADGANGGLCSGANCATASAPGANGSAATAAPNLDGSGGGGGGGRIQIVTANAALLCGS